MKQPVAFDTCTAINVITQSDYAATLRRKFRGKPLQIILCSRVVCELQKKEYDIDKSISAIQQKLGRTVRIVNLESRHIAAGRQVSKKFHTCHHGDNFVLAYCRAESIPLITDDGGLYRACRCLGVAAFFPSEAANL